MNYGISSSLHHTPGRKYDLVVDLGLICVCEIEYSIHLAQGVARKRIGRKGTKEGVFIDPSGIVVDVDDYMLVGDSKNVSNKGNNDRDTNREELSLRDLQGEKEEIYKLKKQAEEADNRYAQIYEKPIEYEDKLQYEREYSSSKETICQQQDKDIGEYKKEIERLVSSEEELK